MSVLAHIGRSLDKKLITALLRAGDGQRLLAGLAEAPGVLSISHHHARGVGNRRVRSGQLFFREHDILIVLAEAERADALFARIYEEGAIGEHGTGMVFMEKVLRGHPMMPLDLADW
jgi:nitrogen regulatory protein PII